MSKHYDVVVLGGSLGALAAAALLARRSWRVLVLGQGHRAPTYSFEGMTLARRPFTLLAASSPAWGRVIQELAQSQTFRRRTYPLDPMFQVLGDRLRLDMPPDSTTFGREIDREFPGVRRVVDELYGELARTNAAADGAFEKDVVWPPGGFWERRETERVLSTLPHLGVEGTRALLAEFPREHPYRAVVELPARFASDLHGTLPAFAVARLQGAWTRGVVRLARGEDEVRDFLVERIRAHGGDISLNARATSLVHKGGRVSGVCVDGDDPTGVQFAVGDLPTRTLLDLAHGFVPSRRALAALPTAAPRGHRFVVSVVVRAEGLPSALGVEAFLAPPPESRLPMLHVQRAAEPSHGTYLLVAEALLERDDPAQLGRAREEILACLERYVPFVERHYVLVDSVHDGRPLWDFRTPAEGRSWVEVDRTRLRAGGGSPEAEPMASQWLVEPAQLYGLAGEPLRAPLAGAFVIGPTTMPALGQEGTLLAAWGAARAITRTDRRKEKMRRDMWSKVELG